jgi:hypothetical protein
MEGLSPVQQGIVGVITAGLPLGPWTEELAQKLMEENEFIWSDIGLESDEWMERRHECAKRYQAHIKAQDFYYPYDVDQPYIEWYANSGRVVLELDPPQIKIFDIPRKEKSPKKLLEDAKRRIQIFGSLMVGMGKSLSK